MDDHLAPSPGQTLRVSAGWLAPPGLAQAPARGQKTLRVFCQVASVYLGEGRLLFDCLTVLQCTIAGRAGALDDRYARPLPAIDAWVPA